MSTEEPEGDYEEGLVEEAEQVVHPSTLEEGIQAGYYITETLKYGPDQDYICINDDAIWKICDSKEPHDIDALLDDSTKTFWQSDGRSPHHITIQFPKRVSISEVAIYLSWSEDLNYCPSHISLRHGTLRPTEDIRTIQINQADGWVRIPVGNRSSKVRPQYLRTWQLQIVISAMHDNGRDCHIRGVKILSPNESIIHDKQEFGLVNHRRMIR